MTTGTWTALADVIDPPDGVRAELVDVVALAAHLDPRYQVRAHVQVIARELAALEQGAFDRLLINCPPQVGKSVTAVEWGAFWWLCLHPTTRIVIGCYGDDLAVRRGKAIRRLIERHGAQYGLHLERGSASMKDWTLTSGGGVRSVGVGSGITGHDAELIFIDDPIAGRQDADSKKKRDSTAEWYSADILSRQSPGCPIVMIQTPWHEDDLRARVVQDEGDIAAGGRWRVVVMPALCTHPDTDPLGRQSGDPIPHPKIAEGNTTALLKHWHSLKASVSARDWQSLWQCDPKPNEGALLSWQLLRERRCYEHGRNDCAAPRIVAVAIDPSGGGRDTAGIIGGYLGEDGRCHISHDRSGVMPSDLWARVACELAVETDADRFIIEKNFGGDMALLTLRTAWDALRREDPDRFGVLVPRIVDVNARRNKQLRAEPVAQQWKEGRVVTSAYLPDVESEWATWQVGSTESPGRLDASVYLALSVLPVPSSGTVSLQGAVTLSETSLLPWGR
jgi:hypothetical protein